MVFDRIFYDKYIEKECKLLIIKNSSLETKFQEIVKNFLELDRIKTCTFDLEFTQRQGKNVYGSRAIEIIQLGLHFDNELMILFCNPNIMSEQSNMILRDLLIDDCTLKIGHGSDSLDIPALFEFLNNDHDILRFISKFYDTRFMCEYLIALTDKTKCNIYTSLEQFNVIDNEQLTFLVKNEEAMGKYWWKTIDIRNLDEKVIDYAMYDTLYLKKLAYNLKEIIKSQDLCYNLILEISRYSVLVQQKIITVPRVKDYNMYLYERESLISYFTSDIEMYLERQNVEVKKLFAFGYFKNKLIDLLRIVHYNTFNLKLVFVDKKNVLTENKQKYLINSLFEITKILDNYQSLKKVILEFFQPN